MRCSLMFWCVLFAYHRCVVLGWVQATVMSKVISYCLSIEYDKTDLHILQLQELGRKHQYIVQDPWQYAYVCSAPLGPALAPPCASLLPFVHSLSWPLPVGWVGVVCRIYATTLHSTIKLCLGDDATPQIMTAWLHVFAFVLRYE
jgi:hypothetical protein